ncbi:MAG: hypothetical protein IT449_08890 [Phycisphaerales bacterium]|nr:hypothetical protein [Phycisphaerales bacterium]
MVSRLQTEPTETCAWMAAGVLTYKLCDRHFDCEHCPLDVALRGGRIEPGFGSRSSLHNACRLAVAFPEDRLYSIGHTWLQHLKGGNGRLRFGLDGFAAALLAPPRSIRWRAAPGAIQAGQSVCSIAFDGGALRLSAPAGGCLVSCNAVLDDDPAALVDEPYAEGWIADFSDVDELELTRLMSAGEALRQARMDLRLLRRRVALHLLADDRSCEAAQRGDSELPCTPWRILGGTDYPQLVQELVH